MGRGDFSRPRTTHREAKASPTQFNPLHPPFIKGGRGGMMGKEGIE